LQKDSKRRKREKKNPAKILRSNRWRKHPKDRKRNMIRKDGIKFSNTANGKLGEDLRSELMQGSKRLRGKFNKVLQNCRKKSYERRHRKAGGGKKDWDGACIPTGPRELAKGHRRKAVGQGIKTGCGPGGGG